MSPEFGLKIQVQTLPPFLDAFTGDPFFFVGIGHSAAPPYVVTAPKTRDEPGGMGLKPAEVIDLYRKVSLRPDGDAYRLIVRGMDRCAADWARNKAPGFWRQGLHVLRYACPLIEVPTECPRAYPFRENLEKILLRWSDRSLSIFVCQAVFNAGFASPLQSAYRDMLADWEDRILKQDLSVWLRPRVEAMLHDRDPNVVNLALFYYVFFVEEPTRDELGHVVSLLKKSREDGALMAQSLLHKLLPGLQATCLEFLRKHVDGLPSSAAAKHGLLRLIQARLGFGHYR